MGERLRRLPNLETTLDRILIGLSNLRNNMCVYVYGGGGGGGGGGGQYSEPPETFITTIMTTTNLFAIPPYEHVKSRIKSSS